MAAAIRLHHILDISPAVRLPRSPASLFIGYLQRRSLHACCRALECRHFSPRQLRTAADYFISYISIFFYFLLIIQPVTIRSQRFLITFDYRLIPELFSHYTYYCAVNTYAYRQHT